MKCPISPDAVVAVGSPSSVSARRPVTLIAAEYGPAPITDQTQTNGIGKLITSRASKLRHSNRVQRQRYLETHQALASRIYSGAGE